MEEWRGCSLEEKNVAARDALAPAPVGACASTTALGVVYASVGAQRVLGFVVLAFHIFRGDAFRDTLAPAPIGASAFAFTLTVLSASVGAQRVLRFVIHARYGSFTVGQFRLFVRASVRALAPAICRASAKALAFLAL